METGKTLGQLDAKAWAATRLVAARAARATARAAWVAEDAARAARAAWVAARAAEDAAARAADQVSGTSEN